MPLLIVAASDDWPGWLLAAGPVGAASFYWAVWMYYRNTNKSHSFERETHISVGQIMGGDQMVGTNNGTREREIRGKNSDKPRQRL